MDKEAFSAANLIRINGKEEDQPSSTNKSQIPIIDFSLLSSTSSYPESAEELAKFHSALCSWGCFQLVNHGISREVLDELKKKAREFFRLPMEEKKTYAMSPGETNGYDCSVAGDSIYSKGTVPDWNEGLSLTVYPEDRRLPQFWPSKPPELREILHECSILSVALFEAIFKTMLHCLKVDENKVVEKYLINEEINVRFNFYPKCPNPPEKVLGLKAHSDFSPITIVSQDEEGLQVLKDGEWFMVPAIPDALFVNIGDPMEILSNGVYKGLVHRVVTNPEKSRLSVALFWDGNRDGEIEPLDELVTADSPPLYQRVNLKAYAPLFFQHYQNGQRVIDTIRI